MKDEDLVVYSSDKTGHLTLITKKNYVEIRVKNVENDPILDDKKLKKLKSEVNEHKNIL